MYGTKGTTCFGGTDLGQYVGCSLIFEKEAGGEKFLIFHYRALNVFGFTGSEKNGIGIVNNTRQEVILDEHLPDLSGYYGPGRRHIEELKRIKRMKEDEFAEFILRHPGSRL